MVRQQREARQHGGRQARRHRRVQDNRVQINHIHDRGAQARMGLLAGLLLLFVTLVTLLLYLILT